MLTSFTSGIYIFVLLTLTKSQDNYGADPSHVTQRKKDDVSAPNASPPRPVVVRCHADSWEVVVQADLFSTGLTVDGGHLRLGVEQPSDPSACRAVPSGPTQFTVRAPLLDCGTVKLPSTKDKIVYSNVLVYSPEPSSDGLLRLDGATIPVQCHYDRLYSARTLTLLPTWATFVSQTTAESWIQFNLRLMTGDWQFERNSPVYYVGEPLHFEASFTLGNHKPLRVFVDHCVATATPDPQAALRYDFIDHRGCLADAYLTKSSARFLPRTVDHRIQFQLDSFRFYRENANQVDNDNQIYITCHLTAVSSMINVKFKHRSCSLIDNRWHSADGDDEDCTSCAIPYPVESPSRAPAIARHGIKPEQPITPRGLGRNMPKQQHQRIHKTPQTSTELMRKGTVQLGPLIFQRTPRGSNSSTQSGSMTLGIVP